MLKLPFLIALVGCIIPTESSASNDELAIEAALRSSMVIQVKGPGGWMEIGSGTLVRDSELGLTVVTAQHVAEAIPLPLPYQACWIMDRTKCVALGNHISDSDHNITTDWALYPVVDKPKGMRPARVSHSDVEIGDEVFQIGAPAGKFSFYNEAEVAWVYTDALMLHGFAQPGSSGGGVFDEWGRLIGITVAMPIIPDALGYPAYAEDMVWVTPISQCEIL